MCMTRAGLDAAEWELRGHDSAVMSVYWPWVARGEWIVILQRQREDDGVFPSLFAEGWTVDGCEKSRWWPVGEQVLSPIPYWQTAVGAAVVAALLEWRSRHETLVRDPGNRCYHRRTAQPTQSCYSAVH